MSSRAGAVNSDQVAARDGRVTALAIGLVFVLTCCRLVYASQLGMAEDETYYWQWSRHLASSYYDQGPGIAYLIRCGTMLFGNDPFGVRFPTILLGAGTGLFVFATVRRWTGSAVGALWSLVLLNIAPLIAAGSVLATYDGPQVFCWAAALWALTETLEHDRAGGWYIVGILTGLGILCKLTMLLFAPGVLVFLLWVPRYRRWLTTPHPYLSFAIALALFSPIILWNASHGWMGFLHTITLGSRHRDATPFRWFGDFLGGQCIAVGPFLFLAELYALFRLARDPRRLAVPEEATKFLLAFSAPTIALCLVVSLKSKMEINWPAPAHLTGLALVGLSFAALWRTRNVGARLWVGIAAALSLIVSLIAFFPTILTLTGRPVSADAAQKLNETYGWPEIASHVENQRKALASLGKPVFVAGINYRVNSELAFYLPDQPQTQSLYLDSRRDEYWLWTKPPDLVGQNAILCLDNDNADAVADARKIFARVDFAELIEVHRPGFSGAIKHWNLYRCYDFKGYNPNQFIEGY